MKRVFAVILALVMCAALACPVFAAQEEFVPSITYKGEPELVPVKDADDKDAVGVVYNKQEENKPLSYIYDDCLIITSVANVDASEEIPEAAAEQLKEVYNALTSGEMKLPYDKVAGYAGQDMTILELLDVSWLCGTAASSHDHPTEVEPEGIVFDVTFRLGVSQFTKVVVMTYKNGEWNPIEDVVNNGDGTVTCTFEHLCPVVFCVSQNYTDIPSQTGDTSNIWIWFAVMLAALAGIVSVAVVGLRKKKR